MKRQSRDQPIGLPSPLASVTRSPTGNKTSYTKRLEKSGTPLQHKQPRGYTKPRWALHYRNAGHAKAATENLDLASAVASGPTTVGKTIPTSYPTDPTSSGTHFTQAAGELSTGSTTHVPCATYRCGRSRRRTTPSGPTKNAEEPVPEPNQSTLTPGTEASSTTGTHS